MTINLLKIPIFVLLTLTVVLGATQGATYYVPDDFPTIQDAIDGATNGDTIIVRPGTQVERINFSGKEVTVTAYGASEGKDRGVYPVTFSGASSGKPTKIEWNFSSGDAVVVFENGEGPGAVLDGFHIKGGSGSDGGAVACRNGSSPTITNCSIEENMANQGAAIFCSNGSSPTISNCSIIDNHANQNGGAICCLNNSNPILTNNTIYGNTAGLAGGAIYCENSSPIVTNTILWKDHAPDGDEIGVLSGSPAVTYCDVDGGWPGTGNIHADPLFVDTAAGDFHLTWSSPCVNAGSNGAPALPPLDILGDPRIVMGVADMGADEFNHHLYYRGEPIGPGKPIDIGIVGPPYSPVALFVGTGSPSYPGLFTPYGYFLLHTPCAWRGPIGSTGADGSRILTLNAPALWTPGEVYSMQALIGDWGELDTKLSNVAWMLVEPVQGDYKWDDGSTENLLGWAGGGDIVGMHRFDTIPGGENLTRTGTIYGSAVFPGFAPGNGTPTEFYVWEDLSNDHAPTDCVLTYQSSGVVANVDTDIHSWDAVSVAITTDVFWVGYTLHHGPSECCLAMDTTTPYVPGNAFYAGTSTQYAFDPTDLYANEFPPVQSCWGFFTIRAEY